MEPVMIPTLLFWENKNTWYGSKGLARFFIQPVVLEHEDGSSGKMLQVELWRGPLMMSLSEVIETEHFPMTEEGLQEVVDWLELQAALLNNCQ